MEKMIRIIKKGKLVDSTSWKREVTCRRCEAILEIEYTDLQTGRKTGGGNPHDLYEVRYMYVICPECNAEIELVAPKFRSFDRLFNMKTKAR